MKNNPLPAPPANDQWVNKTMCPSVLRNSMAADPENDQSTQPRTCEKNGWVPNLAIQWSVIMFLP